MRAVAVRALLALLVWHWSPVPHVAATPSMRLNSYGQLTPQAVTWLLSRYQDWSVPVMSSIAWCEARDKPAAWNPSVVVEWITGKGPIYLHSTGLLGQLGGSTNPVTAVSQAHSLWLARGYEPWRSDFDGTHVLEC